MTQFKIIDCKVGTYVSKLSLQILFEEDVWEYEISHFNNEYSILIPREGGFMEAINPDTDFFKTILAFFFHARALNEQEKIKY